MTAVFYTSMEMIFLILGSENKEQTIHTSRIKEDAHEIIAPDWKETEDDDTMNMIKDTANVKLKIMNVATAMATLGMANTRGLEDPSVGPMLLSHA